MNVIRNKSEFTSHQKYQSDYRSGAGSPASSDVQQDRSSLPENEPAAPGKRYDSPEEDAGISPVSSREEVQKRSAPLDSESAEILREVEEIEAEDAEADRKRREREETQRLLREREEEQRREEEEERQRRAEARREEREKRAVARREQRRKRAAARRERSRKNVPAPDPALDSQTSATPDNRPAQIRMPRRIVPTVCVIAAVLVVTLLSHNTHSGDNTAEMTAKSTALATSGTAAMAPETETETVTEVPTTEADPGGIISSKVRGMTVTDRKSARSKISAFAKDNGLTLKDYPDFIVEHMIDNPESVEFDLNYPLLKDNPPKIDRSEFTNLQSVPEILQWDERWGYQKYSSSVIGITGCGPTAISMVAMYLLQNPELTPDVIATFCQNEGYTVTGQGTDWALITEGAKKLGMKSEQISENKKRVFKELKEGNPVIVVVGPGDFTDNGHFLVLTGIEKNKIRLNDPNSIVRSQRLWSWEELTPQINALWVLQKGDDSAG